MKNSIYNILVEREKDRSLVFNTYSGAVAWIEDDYVNNKQNMDKLKQLGFAVENDEDEVQKVRQEWVSAIYDPSPKKIKIVIAPTLLCNLSCQYCFERDGRSLNYSMDEKRWKKMEKFLIEYIDAIPSIEKINVTWFGGEPCLCIDEISEFSKHIIPIFEDRKISYESKIVTNGVLLTNDNVEILVNKCKTRYAQITIDGDAESYCLLKGTTKDIYKRVLNNIEVASNFLKIDLRVNVNNKNKKGVKTLLNNLFRERNLCGKVNVGFAPIKQWNDVDSDYMNAEEYLAFLKDIYSFILENGFEKSFYPRRPLRKVAPCGLMKSCNFCIDPEGNIYKCEHLLGQKEWSIGNIEEGIEWNTYGKLFLDFQPMQKCVSCKALPLCAGGCPAEKILYGNHPLKCKKMGEFIKTQVRFAVKAKERENNGVDL